VGWHWPKKVRPNSAQHIIFYFGDGLRPAACFSCRWKKKEQSPAKEKGSSRLELLQWLRRKLLPWLPLGRERASGQGGGRCFCCCRCCRGHNGREGGFLQRRERSGATTTWDGLMATGGGDDREKTDDEDGGGWKPRWREKAEKGSVTGKMSREGWFSANFEFDFLLL